MGDGLSESTRRLRPKLIAGVVLAVIAIGVGFAVGNAGGSQASVIGVALIIAGGFLLLWFGWMLAQYEWARTRRR